MEKIRLAPVLLVEGKYDAAKLSEFVDGLILTTEGFSVFTDREKQALILQLGLKRGLLVLTDSDAAGFRIRRFINDIAQNLQVKNLYIPSVPGKESRKAHSGKEGLLGVEGMDIGLLRQLLEQAGQQVCPAREGRSITYADLYELGVSGTPNASVRRRVLLNRAGLPLRLSKKALLEVLNSLYSYEEFCALLNP